MIPLDVMTEVKELLRRASNVLTAFESFEESDERENASIEAAYRLIQTYVMGHRVLSKYPHYESWLVQTRGSGFFNAGAFRRLQGANEFRDQIEDGASVSELY